MWIYLIRHGETAANRERVFQFPDVPLSLDGQRQARALAERMSGVALSRILTSDYERARMTSGAIGAVTGLSPEIEPLLRERNFGELRGRPYTDRAVGAGDPFGPDFEPPGGESWSAFHARVDRAWDRVIECAADGPVAVVTHGLVCHSLAARRLSLPESIQRPARDGPPIRLGNTAVSVVSVSPPHPVSLWGCTAHLDG
jgi:probable phosphoglycerate mutase